MWQPWVGHWFPGAGGPERMSELRWSTYIAMWDSIQESPTGRKAGKESFG